MIGALILGGTPLAGIPAAAPATKPGRIIPGTRTGPTIEGGA